MAKKVRVPKIGSIVVVRWFDAWRDATEDGSAEEVLKTVATLELEDVGFYIGERDEYVIISEERGISEQVGESYRHVHRIPKVNIISVTVIK